MNRLLSLSGRRQLTSRLGQLLPGRPTTSVVPARTLLTRKGPSVRCQTLQDAVSHIKSGDRIYVHGISAVPIDMLSALRQREDLRNLEFNHLHLETLNPCDDPALTSARGFFTQHFFVGSNARKNVAKSTGAYIPVFLSEIPKLMRTGRLRPDIALLNLSPPDKHGYCSLGTEIACALPAAETAPIIIAQINRHMPRTFGSAHIHVDSIDYVVDHDKPLPQSQVITCSDVEQRIGKHIAELVPDGACLQMGIGALPNAVLQQLKSHKDLGIHTEMFEEGVIDLTRTGVVTNLRKNFLPGKLVTSFVMGTQRVYDYVDDNPTVVFLDSAETNDPVTIGRNDRVVAINSAIEVDLTGQVCADSVGTTQISGVGGQIDFERGAAISHGGVPIIALQSLTKKGATRIVPTLKVGAGVVTTRAHVHWVVTEHGAVNLFGKNMHDRARLLISIAHPKHREELEKAAYDRLGIRAWR
ncbi:acetyl-CoA hydrolase/transferase family protein [Fimicolochytrium jonesii]|uniref:acetyl-CoA hydrolase/transferase family protein n=1 Tax=Fimicolochytrium jonesii TaxID=1396493 RepID=UPI0022FF2E30|nr:acetyl-CoA hydrolase/transferase family protein [Fimicolochytrium jonesii]KAI8818484.1 acetyl-CoA hydrolase/transferase family protein [Fimicolochytrium jonesii]